MRRGSLVGPFLLIFIGALLLVHNIWPDYGALELLATYWPYLLVAWGVLRLMEILALAARSQPLPRAGITGGEWVLIILICVTAGGIDAARDNLPLARFRMGGVEIFGDTFDYRNSASQTVGDATRIRVENLNGNVRISGGETEQVTVERRMTVRALDEDDAEQAHESCPLEITLQGDQVVVRTNLERHTGPATISSDLEIAVPHSFSVEVVGREGDTDVSNITGNVDVESDRGDARLADVVGGARLNLRRSVMVRVLNLQGNLTLEGQGRNLDLQGITGLVDIEGGFSGEVVARDIQQPLQFESSRTQLRVEQLPGELRIAGGEIVAHRLVGPIRVVSRSQDLRLSDFTGEMEADIERGNVELRPEQAPISGIHVAVESGDIDIALPESLGSSLFARTGGGEITNDFDPSLLLVQRDRELTLTDPEVAEPLVRLQTERGNVTVRKATGEAPAATQLTLESL